MVHMSLLVTLGGPVNDRLHASAQGEPVDYSCDECTQVHQHGHTMETTKALVECLHLV
jgi:hypothetical protein